MCFQMSMEGSTVHSLYRIYEHSKGKHKPSITGILAEHNINFSCIYRHLFRIFLPDARDFWV